MFLALLLVACTPLVGDWSGEVDCGDYAMDVEMTLEWDDGEYVGEGTLDCTDALGSDCEQTFEVQVRQDQAFGEQELDVDLDDCRASAGGVSADVGCDNPDEVTWDGADAIEGEWGDCDVELQRDR